MSKAPSRPPKRAREILKHYLANPQTADSLEGIARWRLLEDIIQRRVVETENAIEWLVDHGYLDCSAGRRAAPPMYRLNQARRSDAERVVADPRRTRRAPHDRKT